MSDNLARYVHDLISQATELAGGTLDEAVRRHAAYVLADTIGVSVAGGHTKEMTRLRDGSDVLEPAPRISDGATVLRPARRRQVPNVPLS